MENLPADQSEVLDRAKEQFGAAMLENRTFYDLVAQKITAKGHAFHDFTPDELLYEPTCKSLDYGRVAVGVRMRAESSERHELYTKLRVRVGLQDQLNIATVRPEYQQLWIDPFLRAEVDALRRPPELTPEQASHLAHHRANSIFLTWQRAWNQLLAGFEGEVVVDSISHTLRLRTPLDPPIARGSDASPAP